MSWKLFREIRYFFLSVFFLIFSWAEASEHQQVIMSPQPNSWENVICHEDQSTVSFVLPYYELADQDPLLEDGMFRFIDIDSSYRWVTVTIDYFSDVSNDFDIREYAKRYFNSDADEMLLLIEEEELLSGANHSMPILRKIWRTKDSKDVLVHQLYFVDRKYGYCFTSTFTPPGPCTTDQHVEIVRMENEYRKKLLQEIASTVRFMDGR